MADHAQCRPLLVAVGFSATKALWLALDDVERQGVDRTTAKVLVHYDFPFGPRVAAVWLAASWPWWGDLAWNPGPVYTISAAAIEAAAEKAVS